MYRYIDGLLYDTTKAESIYEVIGKYDDNIFTIWRTTKGVYFITRYYKEYDKLEFEVFKTDDAVKQQLMKWNIPPSHFRELFGSDPVEA
jgi:hypothetical protein